MGTDHNISDSQGLTTLPGAQQPLRFDGPAYSPEHDQVRLTGQILRVFELMKDGKFRTLREISEATHDPESSISAQLRHLRKVRFGGHTVIRQSRGERGIGLFEYALKVRVSA